MVLDVGTGSGILSIWAAQAGAKKVYAVEATAMAVHARAMVKSNGLSDVIEVIQNSVEEADIPEKVDIIISEWMGYFLLRESMFDSVIVARDKYLKPGGAMYPSHAEMLLAPMTVNTCTSNPIVRSRRILSLTLSVTLTLTLTMDAALREKWHMKR